MCVQYTTLCSSLEEDLTRLKKQEFSRSPMAVGAPVKIMTHAHVQGQTYRIISNILFTVRKIQ